MSTERPSEMTHDSVLMGGRSMWRNWFRYLSFRNKMLVVTLAMCLFSIVVGLGTLTVFEWRQYREDLQNDLKLVATVVADRLTGVLAFDDAVLASETLGALDSHPNIRAGCLYVEGTLYASHAPGSLSNSCSPTLASASNDEFQTVDVPVMLEANELARLRLSASDTKVSDRISQLLIASLFIIAGVVLLAILVIRRVSEDITRPLTDLAVLAKSVAKDHDYSKRAYTEGFDETGELVEAFNHMLSVIESQNDALLLNQRKLEEFLKDKVAAESRLLSLLRNAPDAIISCDYDGNVRAINHAAQTLFGFDESELINQPIVRFLPQFGKAKAAAEAGARRFETEALTLSGAKIPVEVGVSVYRMGNDFFHSVIARDISERRQNERDIRILSNTVEQSPSAVVITDSSGTIEYVNRSFEVLSGYSRQEVIHRGLRDEDKVSRILQIHRVLPRLRAGEDWRGEVKNRRRDGRLFWEYTVIAPVFDEHGKVTHFVQTSEDITVRKEQEARLIQQANFDTLTGLPNRILALDRLQMALESAHRDQRQVGLMFLDLDRFKLVNDTMGHDAGDQLLLEASHRLRSCVREGSTVARFGGDEFIVIVPSIDETQACDIVAQRILEVFKLPMTVSQQALFMTTSIGISVFPADGADATTLLKNADAAMYRAKDAGRNNFQFFTEGISNESSSKLRLDGLLRNAIERNELSLEFQPVIDAHQQTVVAVEALLRWNTPDLGRVGPDQFIPVAEETGLIMPIGDWVMEHSCEQLQRWHREGFTELRMAVNVSSRQFRDGHIVNLVERCLKTYRLSPSVLELEITERMLLEDDPNTLTTLLRLSEMGLTLSIDDFGTGYSALSYLKKYPFDVLKIDKAFVQDITSKNQDAGLVDAIIAMAHSLKLRVIGEGIETHEQFHRLKEAGCDEMQGYLFSRPQTAQALTPMLSRSVFAMADEVGRA